MYKYARENLSSVKEEILPLLDLHWEDVALDKDKIKLNPDWPTYEFLDSQQSLGVYTCRKEDTNELVGYFVVIASKALHYRDHIFAENDIVYIKPEHRKGLVGYKLIKFAIKDLKSIGASKLFVNTKDHKPFDKLLERMGFNLVERVYAYNLMETK